MEMNSVRHDHRITRLGYEGERRRMTRREPVPFRDQEDVSGIVYLRVGRWW